MVVTTTCLEAEQLERIRQLSRRTRVPYAVLIRDAVEAVLARYETRPEVV